MSRSLSRLWRLTQWQIGLLLHQQVAWILGIVTLALIVGSSVLRGFHFGGAEADFIIHFAGAVLLFNGTLLAAIAGVTMFQDGLARGHAALLFCRGVRRSEWLLAQALALLVVLGWLLVLVVAGAAGVLMSAGHGAAVRAATESLALSGGPLVIVAAVSLLAATVFRAAVPAIMAALAVALAGQLAPVIAQARNSSEGVMRAGWLLLDWLVPNFSVVTNGGWSSLAYVGLYAAGTLALAAWLFSRREI